MATDRIKDDSRLTAHIMAGDERPLQEVAAAVEECRAAVRGSPMEPRMVRCVLFGGVGRVLVCCFLGMMGATLLITHTHTYTPPSHPFFKPTNTNPRQLAGVLFSWADLLKDCGRRHRALPLLPEAMALADESDGAAGPAKTMTRVPNPQRIGPERAEVSSSPPPACWARF